MKGCLWLEGTAVQAPAQDTLHHVARHVHEVEVEQSSCAQSASLLARPAGSTPSLMSMCAGQALHIEMLCAAGAQLCPADMGTIAHVCLLPVLALLCHKPPSWCSGLQAVRAEGSSPLLWLHSRTAVA